MKGAVRNYFGRWTGSGEPGYGNRTPDGVPAAGVYLNSAGAVLGSLRPTLQARIFPMVGDGLDVIRSISGHHCIGFAPCSGVDASQKQPRSVLGSRSFPSDSSAGVRGMEHALTRTALAAMAEARN